MGSEESHLKLAKLLLKKAKSDLESGRVLQLNGLHANAVFMAQQCAEKAAKAVLAMQGLDIREHIVSGYFASEVLSFPPEHWEEKLRDAFRSLVFLEEHTIKPRYPMVTPARIWDPEAGYDAAAGEDAVKKAQKILLTLKAYINEILKVSQI